MWNKESGSIWESRKNDMDVLIGSDKDLSLGKSSSGGSGGSDSSSSGGGSGGDKTYFPYPATAVGMATYAYSRIGDDVTTFFDDPKIEGSGGNFGRYMWCAPFIHYCAKKVGYRINNLNFITDETRGMKPYNTSIINKGFTFYLNPDGDHGHHGMIWSKSSTTIVAIEANSNYGGNNKKVQKISYYWNSTRQVYYRNDNAGYCILKYMPNY